MIDDDDELTANVSRSPQARSRSVIVAILLARDSSLGVKETTDSAAHGKESFASGGARFFGMG